ncbi:MAG: M20 family metallopeptidase [Chitinophagales bacterium]
MELKERIRQLAVDILPRVIGDRRRLHQNPELSFREFKTAAYVKSRLDEMEIPWKVVTETGIAALITGDLPSGEVVALRADMDALPITEMNSCTYVSENPGVMHACGHDAHTASLLGAAFILKKLTRHFGGTVKLIFQPGEEMLPGGASLMIREGVLEDPHPTAVFGQHVMPSLESGKIAIRKGKHMASMDEIIVRVKGKGGHGAQPHLNIDPVSITAQIIVALQQVVSRMADPTMPTVLSFGKMIANGAINVIPDEVYLEGTFRTFSESWRNEAHLRMKKIAESLASGMGGSCEFKIVKGYPFLTNEEKLTEQVTNLAVDYLGKENVIPADLWMAAEDFSYFSQERDACFYLLGVGNNKKNIGASLHSPHFDIDENALSISTGLMAFIAISRMGNR